mmetsp:Transcript_35826/g.73265  ORF Transcript_35826/g.73265 Transcript_35826/m.73265 type:complete len:384 (-) Transcript_35826:410-1561(-)|eukprot:CAMPEP_0183295622 /NCGR_PEP_ID=MMETSP0160_2-20130417/3512_1 /TAXON_ID=2839 ORGANISM="Odontella Sinensis, Strain Grunow 1884" /NCGR_SAMPLE_ID=MMETSP0160_2 /ASSEMBLY_ACC=CAM_ASM_000250 /LENGTH=383 /DNA_ID=CAMNT_0025457135 /DNA_START=137 /DNA_END=1288 /DNA_ORIENTATION=+
MSYWDPSRPGAGPPPKITQSKVLTIGLLVFVLASIWPPLILLVTFILSQMIPYTFRVNDDAESRRRFWKEFTQREDFPQELRETPDDIVIEENYWQNNRGMCLLTCIMIPSDSSKIKAVVCCCHGYGDNISWLKRVEYRRLVRAGIAVVMIEYEGHGRSDGTLLLTPSFENLVGDNSTYFKEVTEKRFPGKKCFLMGESMGGAISMLTYNRSPKMWSGVVFLCPMCKLTKDMVPPDWVVELFLKIAGPMGSATPIGKLPMAPAKGDTVKLSFKLEEKRLKWTRHPLFYGRKPRFSTAREILHTTSNISNVLIKKFDAPFLILHGKADKVTCPDLSQMLFDEAASNDKDIKLYEGVWHSLTSGEPDEIIDGVFQDAAKWLLDRA